MSALSPDEHEPLDPIGRVIADSKSMEEASLRLARLTPDERRVHKVGSEVGDKAEDVKDKTVSTTKKGAKKVGSAVKKVIP